MAPLAACHSEHAFVLTEASFAAAASSGNLVVPLFVCAAAMVLEPNDLTPQLANLAFMLC